jgi:phosphoesterase RecJ-like protein
MVKETGIKQVVGLVKASARIAIIPHHNPDGDAIGASLALNGVLKQMGKDVHVVSPNSFPVFLEWMSGASDVLNYEDHRSEVENVIDNADLIFFLDFNSLSRIKNLKGVVENFKGKKIMIDHHPGPEDIADIMISEPAASATCELMYDVINKTGWKGYLTKELAECIYTGIMTDTGSLSYNSSRPEIYHIVADLVEIGVDKDKVHKLVFHSNSFNRMKLLGHALGQKMYLLEGTPAAYIVLTAEELDRFEFKPGDTEGFVNYPLWIEGISVSALFMEHPDKVKVSLRSRGPFPVNQFSEKFFNGGGHVNAAGGEYYGSIEDAVDTFYRELPLFMKEKNQLN